MQANQANKEKVRKLDRAISDIQSLIGQEFQADWFPQDSFAELITDTTNIKCTLRDVLDRLPSHDDEDFSEKIDKILDDLGVK